MDSEIDGAAEPVPSNDPVDPANASLTAQSSGSPLAPGQRWHAYQVGDAIPCEEGWKYHGVNVGMLEDVCIHVRRIGADRLARAETWRKLENGKYPGLIQVSEALEENGFRFETSQVLPPATLQEWADTHQASLDDVEMLLRQLAATVQAIHSVGVVHCNLSLDTIYLVPGDAGLKVLIGGLDRATLYEQSELIELPVDPFYAPPEAAGLTKHRAGPGLRAWDWWSLGRIMQELVLGQPVLGVVLDRDISRITPEIKARAEALLLERDAAGPKAGAVEKMPPMSDDLASLLRGLLSSCRDGRWGWREVQAWLKRETVPDRYDLSRNDRLFLWNDRSFSVPEVAEFFSIEKNWAEGEEQLFAVKNSASFIAFVGREPNLSPIKEVLDSLRDFVQLPAWREFPVEIVRTVITAASWLQIGPERRPLMMRGKRVDASLLRTLIKTEPVSEGLALVRAMIAPPFIQLITSRDSDTARLLSSVSANAQEVIGVAEKNEWLKAGDTAMLARLMACVLESDADLMRHREELKKRFALTRNPQLETIFKAPKAKHKELILLAFAAGEPERTGFVTHLDWNRDRYMILRERGERLAAKLFWLRLEKIMTTGPLVFGRWPWVIILWAGLVAVLGLGAEPPWGFVAGVALAGVLLALRLVLFTSQRAAVMRYSQTRRLWSLRSRPSDCREESAAALPGDALRKPAQVSAELAAINQEIVGLALQPAPEAVPAPSGLFLSVAGSTAGWMCVAGMLGWMSWALVPPEITGAFAQVPESQTVVKPDNEPADAKPKIKLTSEDVFFSDPRTSHAEWNFPEPAYAPELVVRGYVKPTAEQVARALIDGQKLIAPYAPQTAQGIIAVPVTSGLIEPGIMLYDVKRRVLLERRIFKLEQLPESDRSWHGLNNRKVLYLGEPPQLTLERWSSDAVPAAYEPPSGGSSLLPSVAPSTLPTQAAVDAPAAAEAP